MPERVGFHQVDEHEGRESEARAALSSTLLMAFHFAGRRQCGPHPPTGPLVISADPTGVWGFVLIVGYSHWLRSGHSFKSTPGGPSLVHIIIGEQNSHGPWTPPSVLQLRTYPSALSLACIYFKNYRFRV